MEKYMTEEEIRRARLKKKQELEILRDELSSLKPGRALYLNQVGDSSLGAVYFKVSDRPQLKSNIEKALMNQK